MMIVLRQQLPPHPHNQIFAARSVAIMPNGKSGAPCGACRELMVQLMPNSYQEIEVLMDFETEEIVTLGELTPKWWI